MNIYDIGDDVVLELPLTVDGVPTDPGALTLTLTLPAGTQVVRHWPSPLEIVQVSTGFFRWEYTPTTAGLVVYEWASTTPAQAVERGYFDVRSPWTAGPPDATRTALRYRIMDLSPDNPLLVTPESLDAAIAQAVTKYSQDKPRDVVEDETGNGTPYFVVVGSGAVLASWLDQFSQIQWIDYPAGAVSATYQPNPLQPRDWTFYADASKTYLWLKNATPTVSETVRIAYTALHTHTSTTDTIPPADLDALYDLSAYYACIMLATKAAGNSDSTIAADSVNYRDAQLRYKQQAAEWLASYADRMGQQPDGKPAGASAMANLDSRNIAVGWPWLTHAARRR